MKKLVVFLVMAMMIFSFVGSAFAADFSDVKDLGKGAQDSIAKLSILKVINGYPDGTFKPANTITRAEFAKIAVILGGLEKSADVLKNSPTKFKDVAASQWYTGWINLAEAQGYVKGFPDGTFRPNAKISYAQVVTVLLRVLGYNDNLPGPWPVDYIAKAGALDITKDVAFSANTDAARVDVAVMSDAALDCNVVKWNADDEGFVDKNAKETTLLKQNFDTAVNEDYLVTGVEFEDGTWTIDVEGTDEDDLNGVLDLSETCVISNGDLPIGLGNKIVDVVYNDDDKEVLYIDVTSTTVAADGEEWSYNAAKDEFEINGVKYDQADSLADADVYGGDASYNKDAYYRASINSDREVYKVSKVNNQTPAIVESFEDGELTLKDAGNYGDYDKIEGIDFEKDSVLIKKDGAFVDPEALKANDAIYVSDDMYGYDFYIEVAGSISKTGILEAVKDASVKIDGKWYDVAGYSLLSNDGGDNFDQTVTAGNLEDSDDETITYFLNKAFQVCFVITDAVGEESKVYGVITDLGYKVTRDGNMINEIKVLKADGTETTYGVDTKEVELYSDELDMDEFIKFSVNEDNKIDTLTVLAQINGEGTVVDPEGAANDYINAVQDGDDDTGRIKFNGTWYTLNDNTVIFNAVKTSGDDAEVVDNDDFIDWAMGKPSVNQVAYVQYNGTKVEYIYVNADVTSATAVDYALIVDKFSKGSKPWVEIDVKGTSQNYEVKGSTALKTDAIYDYSISSNKFAADASAVVFDPASVTGYTYVEVIEVDRTSNAVKIADGTWLYADEDTMIYDYTDYADGEDPVYASSVKAISKGDNIVFIGGANEVDLFVIVTNSGVNYLEPVEE